LTINKKILGERVKRIREENGLTQKDISEGLSSGYISKLEKGEVNPSIEKLEIIAQRLNITLSQLFNFETGPSHCEGNNLLDLFVSTLISYISSDYNLAEKYIESLIEEATSYAQSYTTDFIYLLAGVILFNLKKYDKAIERLNHVVGSNDSMVQKIKIFYLAKSYWYAGNLGKASLLFKKLINDPYSFENEFFMITPNALFDFASSLLAVKNYYAAKFYALKYVEICNQINYSYRKIDAFDLIGLADMYTGSHLEAINYFHKFLRGCLIFEDRGGLALVYNHLAETYYLMGDMDRALKYYRRSYEFYKKLNNNTFMAYNLNSIARIYLKLNRPNEALGYAKTALEVLNHQDCQEEEKIKMLIREIETADKRSR
jgi:Tetratricopeptide repeat./Helix-turn-helix.